MSFLHILLYILRSSWYVKLLSQSVESKCLQALNARFFIMQHCSISENLLITFESIHIKQNQELFSPLQPLILLHGIKFTQLFHATKTEKVNKISSALGLVQSLIKVTFLVCCKKIEEPPRLQVTEFHLPLQIPHHKQPSDKQFCLLLRL